MRAQSEMRPSTSVDFRSVGKAFEVVGDGHVARHEDMCFDSGRGRVGGERTGGVTRGRHGEFLQTVVAGHGDGHRQAACLEGSGRIVGFFLEEKIGVATAAKHGRPALAEGDRRHVRQHAGITPHSGAGCAIS